jgi:leucine-rich PPR motif-containing protein, mitochondrial
MESARGILDVMKQAGLQPTADSYSALLSGHAKQGDIEAIRAVIAECDGLEIELLDRDLAEVIFALAKAGHIDLIPEARQYLKKKCI